MLGKVYHKADQSGTPKNRTAGLGKPLNNTDWREKIRILKEYGLDYEAEPAS